MIPVAADGSILDGDNVLAIAGPRFFAEGKLPLRTVVATVMSNLGLEKALGARDLRLLRTPVGDRHVYREMVGGGHPIGGEQSGHLIFLEDSRTGDGILAAIRLIDCLSGDGRGLAEEARAMTRYPQILLNFKVPRKVAFEELPRVGAALAEAEAELRGEGRILLRYSGTEPLARVMVEGSEKGMIESLAKKIGDAILGSIR
jgi:phosphoglucosamine mutase